MSIDKFGRPLHHLKTVFHASDDEDGEFIDFENKRILGINSPVGSSDAVNKIYLEQFVTEGLEKYIKKLDLVTNTYLQEQFVSKRYLLETYDEARKKVTDNFVRGLFTVFRNRLSLLNPNVPITAATLKTIFEP